MRCMFVTGHRAGDRRISHPGLDEARDVQPRRADGGGELPGLRAEVTVLRAAAGLQADDALDLDLRPAPAHPYLVRQLQELGQPLVRQLQALQRLELVEPLAVLQHLLAGHCQNVGHAHDPA